MGASDLQAENRGAKGQRPGNGAPTRALDAPSGLAAPVGGDP